MTVSKSTVTPPKSLPFLEAICWQMADIHQLTPQEMLQRYERGWHYRDVLGQISAQEQAFIDSLIQQYGSWLNGMFTLDQHQKILQILNQFNADFLTECQVYFGGGTLLALKYDEYRLSQDIDFLCSDQVGYRNLRRAIFERRYQALFKTANDLAFPREIQANQYGVRFPVVIEGSTIRCEIVSEGRINLESPDSYSWCPVSCLNLVDTIAEKLLANSDRWLDRSVLARDVIDLCVLRLQGELPSVAIAKAEAAYPVMEPLRRAVVLFQQEAEYRQQCYEALQIKQPALIMNGLDQLAMDFDLELTQRTQIEVSEPESQ